MRFCPDSLSPSSFPLCTASLSCLAPSVWSWPAWSSCTMWCWAPQSQPLCPRGLLCGSRSRSKLFDTSDACIKSLKSRTQVSTVTQACSFFYECSEGCVSHKQCQPHEDGLPRVFDDVSILSTFRGITQQGSDLQPGFICHATKEDPVLRKVSRFSNGVA